MMSVPLVMSFSKLLPDARNILRKHSKVLYRSDRMKAVFDEIPILAYSRAKNLCDVFVHSKTANWSVRVQKRNVAVRCL